MTLDFRQLWDEAINWPRYLSPEMDNYRLWEGIHRRFALPPWAAKAARDLTGLRLLVLAEDWCGDASNTVPLMARLAEGAPGGILRILPRDQYPQVMNQYLTNGSRSIPLAIGLDEDFQETGHWGPRPTELQTWVLANKAAMPAAERYAQTRRWYAKDRGESTLRELLAAIGGKS